MQKTKGFLNKQQERLFFLLFALLCANSLRAQPAIWNAGFENWDTLRAGVLAPHQWTTIDTLISGYQTVTPTTNAYSGSHAVRMAPFRGTNPIRGRRSALILGKIALNPRDYRHNIFISGQPFYGPLPQAIRFYYQYAPGHPSDSLVIEAFTTKANTVDPWMDRVRSAGYYALAPQQSGYQQFTAILDPVFPSYPDTCDSLVIAFTYYSRDTSANPTGYALIDQIQVLGTLDISSVSKPTFQIAPNPATDFLYLTGFSGNPPYQLLDFTGRVVQSGFAGKGTIPVAHLPPGTYLFRFPDLGNAAATRVMLLR